VDRSEHVGGRFSALRPCTSFTPESIALLDKLPLYRLFVLEIVVGSSRVDGVASEVFVRVVFYELTEMKTSSIGRII
jgi:hypothetical protein